VPCAPAFLFGESTDAQQPNEAAPGRQHTLSLHISHALRKYASVTFGQKLQSHTYLAWLTKCGQETMSDKERSGMKHRVLPKLILALLLSSISIGAHAVMLTLSDVSSDATDASLLDATMQFDVTGTQLSLVVTNNTADPNAYRLTEVFFNANSNVSGLSYVSATSSTDGIITSAWSLSTNQGADGMGKHDFALFDGTGNDPDQISSGENVTFLFNIGSAGVTATDFLELSTNPPGSIQAYAVIKFTGGPGDDSAFGGVTVVPLPAAIWLLISGISILPWLRRRAARQV